MGMIERMKELRRKRIASIRERRFKSMLNYDIPQMPDYDSLQRVLLIAKRIRAASGMTLKEITQSKSLKDVVWRVIFTREAIREIRNMLPTNKYFLIGSLLDINRTMIYHYTLRYKEPDYYYKQKKQYDKTI